MQLKRTELIAALEEVKPGLAQRDIIAQSTSFVFAGDSITTFNDEISVWKPFKSGIEGAVRANELYSLLSKIKDEEIEIGIVENELIIKGKRSKAGIKLEAEIMLPLDEVDIEHTKFTKLPDNFLKAISIASYCAAKDLSKPLLTCVYIDGEVVTASDDFRIIQVNFDAEVKSEPILLPASVVKFLVKYDVKRLSHSPGWIHFHANDGLIFSARVLAGKFPEVEQFLKVKGKELHFPAGVLEMLDRAGVFTADSASGDFVTVAVEDRTMTIKGKGDYGWLEETANCKYKGEKIEFDVDPSFLIDILKNLRKCIVGNGALLFEGDNFRHVVALVG